MKPSNFKEWLWSAKVLTTIVWILFPWGYMILIAMPEHIPTPTPAYAVPLYPIFATIPLEFLEMLGLSYLSEMLGLFASDFIIPPITFMIVLLVFSVIPAIFSTEYFFKRRGSTNVVIEYRYIRKILYASLIALIIIIIAFSILNSYLKYVRDLPRFNYDFVFTLFDVAGFLYVLEFMLPAVPFFILLKLLLEHARKQFRFYYGKACFEIINEKKSETDKAEYLGLGLDWYNKFVKRITKSEIDVETMYSKIISNSKLSNNILLDTITDSFHSEDELKPMRHMLALLSCWKEGATLVKESIRTKLKESSDLLIPIVTVVITIMTTFFLKAPTSPPNGG